MIGVREVIVPDSVTFFKAKFRPRSRSPVATFFFSVPKTLEKGFFLGQIFLYVHSGNSVEDMIEYAKKSFLSVYWVCKWRKGTKKHLQMCLQAPDTIPRGQIDYFLYWISDTKKKTFLVH